MREPEQNPEAPSFSYKAARIAALACVSHMKEICPQAPELLGGFKTQSGKFFMYCEAFLTQMLHEMIVTSMYAFDDIPTRNCNGIARHIADTLKEGELITDITKPSDILRYLAQKGNLAPIIARACLTASQY